MYQQPEDTQDNETHRFLSVTKSTQIMCLCASFIVIMTSSSIAAKVAKCQHWGKR